MDQPADPAAAVTPGGPHAPLVPVVTLPAGTPVSSPPCCSGLRASRVTLPAALPGAASPSSPPPATGRSSPPTAAPRSCSPTRGRTNEPFGNNTQGRQARSGGARRRHLGGAPVHLSGLDALQDQTRRRNGPGVLARGDARRPRRARRARLRVRLLPRLRADADGPPGDHDDLPPGLGPHDDHRRLPDRGVPDRADRTGRRHRLLAAGGGPLARGAGPRHQGDAAIVRAMADRRPRRRLQRHHRRHRPPRPDRAAVALPAHVGYRRHADPADERGRRSRCCRSSCTAGEAARLAAPADRRQGLRGLDALGAERREPPLGRGERGHRGAGPPRGRGDRSPARPGR